MTSKSFDPETLDFILQATKDGPESQSRDIDALDAKVFQVFAAASIILGLASFSQEAGGGDTTTALLGGALAAYVVAVVASVIGLFTRNFHTSFHANTMWETHHDKAVEQIKLALVTSIADAYSKNNKLLKVKSRAARVVIGATAAEAFLVGLAIILARIA